jgi:hypothetical protein
MISTKRTNIINDGLQTIGNHLFRYEYLDKPHISEEDDPIIEFRFAPLQYDGGDPYKSCQLASTQLNELIKGSSSTITNTNRHYWYVVWNIQPYTKIICECGSTFHTQFKSIPPQVKCPKCNLIHIDQTYIGNELIN